MYVNIIAFGPLRTIIITFFIICSQMTLFTENLPSDPIRRAEALHKKMVVIDGHNDLPWQYRKKVGRVLSKMDINQLQPALRTDIPRLREGAVGGQFWSVYVSSDMNKGEYLRATLEQIDLVYRMIRAYPETFHLALTANQLEQGITAGKISSIIALEGGHSIDNSLSVLRMLYHLGARSMTLTHNLSIPWADSATDTSLANGLTRFGKEVVREMNRMGMIVDLSHVSRKTMHDALDVTESPVIFSHSLARALTGHPRNVPDDVLKRLPQNGGIVMVTFVPKFVSEAAYNHSLKRDAESERLKKVNGSTGISLEDKIKKWDEKNPEPTAKLSDVADHIDYIRKVAGIEHIGIGSDFEGTPTLPQGLEDVSKFPKLTAELLLRGYRDEDIEKILGGNILRVIKEVEKVSSLLKQERRPSEALIEELDKL